MDPAPQGPVEYRLGEMPDERFESLVFLLARSQYPDVVPVRVKDHGLDARLPDPKGRTLRGWQAKRHKDINWNECQGSVRRAMAFWRAPRITFCFPNDLSARDQENFRLKLIDCFPHVRLDFWSGAELQRLIRDTPDGKRAAQWLFGNPDADRDAMLRALAVGGDLSTSEQAAKRQAVIQSFMDRDPHVHYTMVSRSPGGPETPPAEGTFLSVTLVIDEQEVRFDATERYPGALEDLGAVPSLAFADDEDGHRARDTASKLAREGGRATITAGLGTMMAAVPVGLRGLMPAEGLWGHAELVAVDEPVEESILEPTIPVIVRAAGTELGLVLAPGDAPKGWLGTMAGAAGGLELFQSVRGPSEGEIQSRLDWRYTRGEGTGLEQLLACRIMLAGLRGESVELIDPEDRRVLVAATIDPPQTAEDDIVELQELETFLGYVAEVEAWLGAPLSPPAHPTEADARALGWLVPLVRDPTQEATWTRIEMAPGAKRPENDGPWQFAFMQPLYAKIFGSDVYVGMEWWHIPGGMLEGEGDVLAIVPLSAPGKATVRLERPDVVPPEAARPR